MVFTAIRPYKRLEDSSLGVICAYCIIFLFIAAFMLKVEHTTKNNADANKFGWTLTFILFASPLYVLGDYLIYQEHEEEEETWITKKLKETHTGVHDILLFALFYSILFYSYTYSYSLFLSYSHSYALCLTHTPNSPYSLAHTLIHSIT